MEIKKCGENYSSSYVLLTATFGKKSFCVYILPTDKGMDTDKNEMVQYHTSITYFH